MDEVEIDAELTLTYQMLESIKDKSFRTGYIVGGMIGLLIGGFGFKFWV